MYVIRDFGGIWTRNTQMTGQGPNQQTKNLMILFSEQITVFEFGDKKHVIFDFGPSHSAMWFCYFRAPQNWFRNVWDVEFELIWLGTYVLLWMWLIYKNRWQDMF